MGAYYVKRVEYARLSSRVAAQHGVQQHAHAQGT